MEQANTEVEQAEVEDSPDPGTYSTTADLAGVRDQVHQQQAPVLQQPEIKGDYRHGPHNAVGQDGTQLTQPGEEGRHDLSQHVGSADNVIEIDEAFPHLEKEDNTADLLLRRLRYRV